MFKKNKKSPISMFLWYELALSLFHILSFLFYFSSFLYCPFPTFLSPSFLVLLFPPCSCSRLHSCPIPSFRRSGGNISQQTDHLGVRPVNVLIVIYSWTEFKKSFSLLTTWSWSPGKTCRYHFVFLNSVRCVRSGGFCRPQILIWFLYKWL